MRSTMKIDYQIIDGLNKNLNKRFLKKKIIIKKIHVKRRRGHVYRILIKNKNKTTTYYAKYYPNFDRAKKILELNDYELNSKKYQITRPVFFLEDIKTLVFNDIKGRKFSCIIPLFITPAYYFQKKKKNNIIKEVVKCLGYIQKNTNPKLKEEIDIDYTLFSLRNIETINHHEKSKAEYILKNNQYKIGELPLLFNHNDLVANNIIISKNSVGFIDVDLFSFDNRIFDLHSFTTNLEFKAILPLYSKKIIKEIQKEFIKEFKKSYPILLSTDIISYTKLNYLILYLFEKQKLEKTMNLLSSVKSRIFMNQIKKNITETIQSIEH
jgi:thiamine kinase-like enzyme